MVLQGAPLLGAIFSIGSLTVESVGKLFVFAVGSCFLVAHIFVLNDWSGIHDDLRDPNRAAAVFITRGIDRAEIGFLWVVLLVVGLLLLSPFGPLTVGIALMIAGLSALDLDGDRRNGIGTNAVTFGKAWSFAAALALFTMADLLLVVLAGRGTVPRALVAVAALYALHLYGPCGHSTRVSPSRACVNFRCAIERSTRLSAC